MPTIQTRGFQILLLAAICLVLSGCAHVALPARGEIAGQVVDTTLDAPVARYYLEHYLRGTRHDVSLDTVLDALHRAPATHLPTRENLKDLSQRYSTDFASLYFAERLSREPRSVPWQRDFHDHLARLRKSGGRINLRADLSSYLILFVPGWDYEKSGHFTGADFASPRARLELSGLKTQLIEIPSTGSVEQNAAVIADNLRRFPAVAPRIILVSASSGGPATAQALANLLTVVESCRVHAWVNIGGLLRGTPLFDPYRSGLRRWLGRAFAWLQGWEWDALESLGRERSDSRFASLRLPGHLSVVNYVGIPMSGNVSELARERYLGLRKHGPNDGLTLIADALVPGQPTIPAMGLDHYLAQDPELGLKTLALALTLIEALEKQKDFTCP
ncbi:MAG TPA: hypothetical protein VIR61_08165 [Sulfuricaulis sp.]